MRNSVPDIHDNDAQSFEDWLDGEQWKEESREEEMKINEAVEEDKERREIRRAKYPSGEE